MDVRLENIHTNASPANYVSFLNQAQRKKAMGADRDSIHSVSSIRSVMSTMTSLWSSLGFSSKSQSRSEKNKAAEKEDLKYLYSAFTKVPCLKLSPDHRAPLIAGYEEFPFDSAVPLFAFKNLTTLEICDVDFRQFFGWDRLADPVCGLQSLSLKRACVDDPADVLVNIVLDDQDRRRRRSAKVQMSPVVGWPAPSPGPKAARRTESSSEPSSPSREGRISNEAAVSSSLESRGSPHSRQRSASPARPSSSRHGSAKSHTRSSALIRRSSGSSNSSIRASTLRGSSSTLLSLGLPLARWRCLRHLSLSDNGLTSISASSLSSVANTLQSLDLSCNLFTEIPDSLASLIALRALNLSNCMIESLRSLVRNPLPAITMLNLRANRLASLAGIERLLSLERVDLRENRLNDPTEVARLTGIPNMIDVYIHRNPFVKGYSNYRLTIFNLFRKTPGYADDIYIDGTQPAYGERKQLADRAPELPSVPIIRPPPSAPVKVDIMEGAVPPVSTPPSLGYETPYRHLDRRPSGSGRHGRRVEHGGSTQRRRKGPRRRIVDISEQGASIEQGLQQLVLEPSAFDSAVLESFALPAEPDQPASETPRPGADPLMRTSSAAAASTTIQGHPPQISPVETSPPILRTGSDPINKPMSQTISPDFNVEGDLYRQKIKALRDDLGARWLSALSDEAWDSRARPLDTAFSPSGPLAQPAGPVRSASQGIVSGGRTLG